VIERFGARGTIWEEIFFTDAETVAGAAPLGEVSVKCYGQNKDLRDVKKELAKRVRSKGGDALIAFKYGQRARFLGGDEWYGSGRVVRMRLR
jgi:hypothetical protein